MNRLSPDRIVLSKGGRKEEQPDDQAGKEDIHGIRIWLDLNLCLFLYESQVRPEKGSWHVGILQIVIQAEQDLPGKEASQSAGHAIRPVSSLHGKHTAHFRRQGYPIVNGVRAADTADQIGIERSEVW